MKKFFYNRSLIFISENMHYFSLQVISCMGILSGLITILSVAFPDEINGCPCIWYTCLGWSFIWGLYKIYPCSNISVTFVKKRTIRVMEGNIWDIKKGIVVVPVNNFFDTQVDDIIVGSGTLHGQFVLNYKKQYPDRNLDSDIQNSIINDRIASSGSYPNRKNVNNGHNDAYPLGEIVRLRVGDIQYYLVVSTQFDVDNHVIHEPEKYSMMLMTMMEKISKWNSGVPVYLPIIGSGQTGLAMNKQEILAEMLSCFNQVERYNTLGGITIMVYEKDMKEISLNRIKYQFAKI